MDEEEEAVASAMSAVLSSCVVPPRTACRLGLWLPSVTDLRLSIVATADDLATTGSLLRPQRLTVSIERVASSAAGGCIISGQPVVRLQPALQLRVPISPTQHVLLPGLPRAQGCLQLVFDTNQASVIFRRAAALARSLAGTLPRDAAPLLAEVRSLLAAQPSDQLAHQYIVQLQSLGQTSVSSGLALAERPLHSRSAASGFGIMNASACSSKDTAADHTVAAAALPQATADAASVSEGSFQSQVETAGPAGSEIQPCTWTAEAPTSCSLAEAWMSATGSGAQTVCWTQLDAARQLLLQAAADSDDAKCTKLTHWQPGADFFLRDGPPRQSCATLCFADWRLEQLFQPWRAAACSQDDGRAAQIMAPLALLAGCCRPLQLFAGRTGVAQWAGHAALLLAYLLVRLLLACSAARRFSAWRQQALVVLWALAAAHAVHYLSAAGCTERQWQSPLVFFRTSGLQTLAIGALILRVQWAWAVPLAAAHALLAMQHVPPSCPAVGGDDGGGVASWATGLVCSRAAAVIAAHWLLMGLVPAVLMGAIDGALRRRFLRHLESSCS